MDANLITPGFDINCNTTQRAYATSLTGDWGFSWSDNLPTGTTVTSIEIEINNALNCNGSNSTASFNGSGSVSLNMAGTECLGCASPLVVNITDLSGLAGNYNSGASNNLTVSNNWPNFQGIDVNPNWGDGNSVYARIHVTYYDTQPPIPDVTNLATVTGECSVTANAPTATDACGGTIVGTTSDPVSYTTLGSHTINWVYEDDNGNTSTQIQTVVVEDTTPPQPDNANGQGTVTITYDILDANLITSSYNIGCGSTLRAYATSLTGDWGFSWNDNLSAGTTITNVEIELANALNCNGNYATTSFNGSGSVPLNMTGTGCLGCASPLVVNMTDLSGLVGNYNSGASNNVTVSNNFPNFQGIDVNPSWGDGSSVYARVHVTFLAESTLPEIIEDCSANVPTPTATDNCEGTILRTTTDPTFYADPGMYFITWNYEDAEGNISTQYQNVIFGIDDDGYTSCQGDCDDNDPSINPGAMEVCDGIDNNCDGAIDEGFDADGDGVLDCFDNCVDSSNPNQEDSDCDGVGDACDVCDGGDDMVDNNNDGLPDCAYPPAFNDILSSWKCSNNKVYICHKDNNKNKCISKNAVSAHIGHGDYLGHCGSANCGGANRVLNTGDGILYFDAIAEVKLSGVDLNWITNIENEMFIIEKSLDGETFEQIHEESGVGVMTSSESFRNFDKQPSEGINYYRLKLVKSTGEVVMSDVRSVTFTPEMMKFEIFPNPAENHVFISMIELAGKKGTISLSNQLGVVYHQQAFEDIPATPVRIDLSNFSAGIYFVKIESEGRRSMTKRLVVISEN